MAKPEEHPTTNKTDNGEISEKRRELTSNIVTRHHHSLNQFQYQSQLEADPKNRLLKPYFDSALISGKNKIKTSMSTQESAAAYYQWIRLYRTETGDTDPKLEKVANQLAKIHVHDVVLQDNKKNVQEINQAVDRYSAQVLQDLETHGQAIIAYATKGSSRDGSGGHQTYVVYNKSPEGTYSRTICNGGSGMLKENLAVTGEQRENLEQHRQQDPNTGFTAFNFGVDPEYLQAHPSYIKDMIKGDITQSAIQRVKTPELGKQSSQEQENNREISGLKFVRAEGEVERGQDFGTCSVHSAEIAVKTAMGLANKEIYDKVHSYIQDTTMSKLMRIGEVKNEDLIEPENAGHNIIGRTGFSSSIKQEIINDWSKDLAGGMVMSGKGNLTVQGHIDSVSSIYNTLLEPIVQSPDLPLTGFVLNRMDDYLKYAAQAEMGKVSWYNEDTVLSKMRESILDAIPDPAINLMKASIISSDPKLKKERGFSEEDKVESIYNRLEQDSYEINPLTNNVRLTAAALSKKKIEPKAAQYTSETDSKGVTRKAPAKQGQTLDNLYKGLIKSKSKIKDFTDGTVRKIYEQVLNPEYFSHFPKAYDFASRLLISTIERTQVRDFSESNQKLIKNEWLKEINQSTIIKQGEKEAIINPNMKVIELADAPKKHSQRPTNPMEKVSPNKVSKIQDIFRHSQSSTKPRPDKPGPRTII